MYFLFSIEVNDAQDNNSNLQKGKVVWEQDSSTIDHLVTNFKQKTQQWTSTFALKFKDFDEILFCFSLFING